MLPFSGESSSIEDRLFPQKYTLQIKGRLVSLEKPKVMGILNITPDSFFEGSRVQNLESQLLDRAGKMIADGAEFLDLGGYSTRPGAADVSIAEEIDRVGPAISLLKKHFPETLISVDTFRSQVAQAAIDAGVDLINDISAGELDSEMLSVVAASGLPYIAMHMRGTPQTMQQFTHYDDLIKEIVSYFSQKIDSFRKLGIKDVILDPGFGFAKTLEQNFELLRQMKSFQIFGYPILVGISRKSMIYRLLQCDPNQALNGTTALNMFSLIQGANLLRVHDVKEAKETITLYEQLYP
jgi:dihydropteroate synthase